MATEVLHVIARMNVGGTARYVGDLVENIPYSTLATGQVQGSEIEDSVVTSIPMIRIEKMGRKISLRRDFQAWLELRQIIRHERPKIVHTHTFKAGLIGRLIPGSHKRVHTFHGHLFDDQSFSSLEKFFITTIERFLARRTDLLISVGDRVGAELRAQGIGPSKNWASIAPGVKPLPHHQKSLARTHLGLADEGVLFGWLARMSLVKNPALLLRVAQFLPSVNFVMAGGGELLEQIRKNAPSNVTVIGWSKADEFWSAIDCALSTSDNEGMPIALIEAQLAGLPAIATDVGSSGEVVQDGVTGILTSKNVKEIAQAVQRLNSDAKLRKSMGNSARERALKEFSVEKMLGSHKKIYANLTTTIN